MKAEVATQIMVVALGFCPLDGVPFVILDGKARFCSPECRRVWEEIRKTEPPFPNIVELSLNSCAWCHRAFVTHRPRQKFCSRGCQSTSYNKTEHAS